MIPIEPKTIQSGNRAAVVNGKLMFFSDKRKVAYVNSIVALTASRRPRKPLSGPLSVHLVFVCSRPKNLYRRKDPFGELYVDRQPDVDNFAKGTIDGLSKARYWRNDSQIVRLLLEKVYHSREGNPCIRVCIDKISAEKNPGDVLPGMERTEQ